MLGKLKIIYRARLLLLSLLLATIAVTIENRADVPDDNTFDIQGFQSVLNNKYRIASENLSDIASRIEETGLNSFITEHARKYYSLYKRRGIVLLAYENHKLKFWNSNVLPRHITESLPNVSEKLVNPENGWYATKSLELDDSITLYALILIKRDYLFENEFLANEFHPDFDMSPQVEIGLSFEDENIIMCNEGKFLFSLRPRITQVSNESCPLIVSVLYSLSILFLLLFIYRSFYLFNFKKGYKKNLWLITVILLLIFTRYLMLEFEIPAIFRSLQLFQPEQYAKSLLYPSLGDLLINSLLILFIIICFSVHFDLIDRKTEPRKFKAIGSTLIFTIILTAVMHYFHYLFEGLIFNSNIQLEVHNFFYLTRFSLIAYLVITTLAASITLLTDKVVFISSKLVELKTFLVIFALIFTAGLIISDAAGYTVNIYAIAFFLSITASVTYIRYFRYHYTYSFQTFLIFLISIFSLAFITDNSKKKDRGVRQLLAVNLANERDQVAEFLLNEAENDMISDTELLQLVENDHEGYDLFHHLRNNYFDGYFRKYEMQIASCGDNFDLLLEDVGELVDCYTFFYDMIDDFGIPVTPESGFYYLDNRNGRISYLGAIRHNINTPPWEKTLFVSLDSKVTQNQLGYPELLLDGKFTNNHTLTHYSHAKYHNYQLITQSGLFSYNLTMPFNLKDDREWVNEKRDGYEHLIYRVDDENIIVLSKPGATLLDILTSFSYIFVFFYLMYGVALLICNYPFSPKRWRIDFKDKIKYSMTGVLLLSLIIIGTGTVYYNIRQFENKQHESISEKIRSVLTDLEYGLGRENSLTPEIRDYVTGRLIELSNIFYTDINLYDQDGNLYASSRPEVFELGLIGEQMNPQAYSEMILYKRQSFIHKESISNLSYLSAYVPIKNTNNELLSYLNLPYFTRQSTLTKEIYTLVVAVVNIYAILILITIFIAIVVSNTITKPLRLIQEKLRGISIGRKNEQIDYLSDDEIGSLIKEYNRMVVELENSAELLAKSERESAWREMAKQIAHEIKNPLTPMKLSIQHLQKSWNDGRENWEETLKKTTNSLIEQIDNLSSIASAFSDFAQLSKTDMKKVDIVTVIKNVTDLFSSSRDIEFSYTLNGNDSLEVISDKMQLNRIFVNLLKNASQAIPAGEKGVVNIELKKAGKMALVKVIDNGEGVHPEFRDKMFIPNFTSKTGGTGMGLALVKSIVEQSGGGVGYESEYKKGSCFYFTIPLAEPPERPES